MVVRRRRAVVIRLVPCGVCGRKTIEGLRQDLPRLEPFEVSMDLVRQLPERMREFQCLFKATGGIHAAGLFSRDGEPITLFEDIGRHNAVDKLIGSSLLNGTWPLGEQILVGAASSLAVELSREAGATLYSFIGPRRGNRHC